VTPAVEEAFRFRNCDAVRYVEYWGDLTARTDAQVFARFLFAYMSVHTTWEGNVSGYQAIKDFRGWLGHPASLRNSLVRSGAGLHNNRARWIDDFGAQYWADPAAFRRGSREPWHVYRDRIEQRVTGLGPAKVSFALELSFPLEAEVLCLDVHMLRLYGVKDQSKVKVGQYERLEADWVGRARAVEMPSYIVKQMHWDRLQGRPDSRYWSHVLEES
jgi:hypothetical protein